MPHLKELDEQKLSNFLSILSKQKSSLPIEDLCEHLEMSISDMKIVMPTFADSKFVLEFYYHGKTEFQGFRVNIGPMPFMKPSTLKSLTSFMLQSSTDKLISGLKVISKQLVELQMRGTGI